MGGQDTDGTGDGDAPRRRPRLADVAAHVGLSPASVSLALRNAPGPSVETRRRVLDAAAELGYRPDRTASLLARRRRHLLGVMIDVRNTFHAELVEHLHPAAERLGYDLALSTVTRVRPESRAVETLVDFRCEALLLLGPDMSAARLAALAEQLPVLVVGRRIVAPGIDVVRTADDQGVGQAVEHLTGLGHRAIAFLDGGAGTIAADRRRGYQQAMRRGGLADRVRVLPGSATEEAGASAVELIRQAEEPPTAVVAFNDRGALGLVEGLRRVGARVPETLSIVGYDDSPLAQLPYVDLTTVSQNAPRQAEEAVAAAVERLDEGRSTPREVVLRPQLVVRGTTGPPPAAGWPVG